MYDIRVILGMYDAQALLCMGVRESGRFIKQAQSKLSDTRNQIRESDIVVVVPGS